uniref:Outer membrane lipoprotein-sorting protein n=1 Tax=candidate division WOR-3 bacterium TaxID=2052148 RepID=A0A7C4YSJ8_UNCW3
MLILFFSLTSDEILKKIDDNFVFNTIKANATMTIERDGKKLVKEFILFGKKDGNRFFIEFINSEDRGVKYLKIGNELWIYFPDADDIMKISGHMLRQGMMGSDISYEDILSDEELRQKYTSELKNDTIIDDKEYFVLELTAKKEDVSYYKERLIVDKNMYAPVEIELFTKSGRMIKKIIQERIKNFDGRYFPERIIIFDLRRKNSKTSLEYNELKFDILVKDDVFTKQNLKR